MFPTIAHIVPTARLLVAGTIAAAILGGCASSRPPAASTSSASHPAVSSNASATEARLRSSVERWEGTPYDFGGTSLQGVDCSAFTQALYRDVLGVPLPRTTRQQAAAGRRVSVDRLQPGDLLFFQPANKQRHVGVYLGNGEFAHASVSQGVMVSEVEDTYWQDVYWMTRRIMPDFSVAARATSPEPDSATEQRAGW